MSTTQQEIADLTHKILECIYNIGLHDWLTILALVLGPLLALLVQQTHEKNRRTNTAKEELFFKLIATRGNMLTRISPEHVTALNLIVVTFYHDKHAANIKTAWSAYLIHLNTPPGGDTENDKVFNQQAWNNKIEDLLATLLYHLGKSLGYDFDPLYLKHSHYAPVQIQTDRQALASMIASLKNFTVIP